MIQCVERTLDGQVLVDWLPHIINDIANGMKYRRAVVKYVLIPEAQWARRGIAEYMKVHIFNNRVVVDNDREFDQEYGIYIDFRERVVYVTSTIVADYGLRAIWELQKQLRKRHWRIEVNDMDFYRLLPDDVREKVTEYIYDLRGRMELPR